MTTVEISEFDLIFVQQAKLLFSQEQLLVPFSNDEQSSDRTITRISSVAAESAFPQRQHESVLLVHTLYKQ